MTFPLLIAAKARWGDIPDWFEQTLVNKSGRMIQS
jgi:hypothetical protein